MGVSRPALNRLLQANESHRGRAASVIMNVEPLISTEFVSYDPAEPISRLVGTFADPRVRGVVIIGDTYEGVVSRRQLATSHHQPDQRLGSLAVSVPRLRIDEDVRRTAQLMIHSDAFLLPVFEQDELRGVVTADAIVEAVTDSLDEVDVVDVWSDELVTISADNTFGQALPQFRRNRIAHLPVVNGSVVGILSLYDLVDLRIREMTRSQGGSGGGIDSFGGEISSEGGRSRRGGHGARDGELARMLDLPVRDLMASPVAVIEATASLRSAVEAMEDVGGSSLVVIEDDEAAGIVTITDILEALTWEAPERRGVQIYGIDLLDDTNYDRIVDMIDRFDDRDNNLTVLDARIHLHEHDETLRGRRLIMARIRLHTDRGLFMGTGEGYGATHAIREARAVLDRRLLEHKEHARSKKPMDDEERWRKRFGWWMDG